MREWVYKLRFDNLSKVESWVHGGPEAKYFVVNSSSDLVNYETLCFTRADVNNKWKYCYVNIMRWYFDEQDGFALKWIEKDDGPEAQTLKISTTVLKKWVPVTISYETKWARKDKDILCKPVDSRDAKYTIYGSSYGIMRWGEAFWF